MGKLSFVDLATYNKEYFLEDCGRKEFYDASIIKPIFLYELNKFPVSEGVSTILAECSTRIKV